MKTYELTYLIDSGLTEQAAQDFFQSITAFITSKESQIEGQSGLRKINLAYPVKKQKQAFIASISFKANPSQLEDLGKKLKSEANILRYIILAIEQKRQKPIRRRKEAAEEKPKKPQKLEIKELDEKIEEMLSQ